jgi:hypothetical protein
MFAVRQLGWLAVALLAAVALILVGSIVLGASVVVGTHGPFLTS